MDRTQAFLMRAQQEGRDIIFYQGNKYDSDHIRLACADGRVLRRGDVVFGSFGQGIVRAILPFQVDTKLRIELTQPIAPFQLGTVVRASASQISLL